MSTPMNPLLQDAGALRQAWAELLEQHHHVHGPEAAQMLNVPEAAMVASRLGHGATQLDASLTALLCDAEQPVSQWGKVLVAVRNGLGVSLCVQTLTTAQSNAGVVHLFGDGFSAVLMNAGIGSVYLLDNEDAHGHTVSLNWFDGAGDVIGRLFLMAKSGRELALPHLLRFAIPAPGDHAFWQPSEKRAPHPPSSTDSRSLTCVGEGSRAAELTVKAVLACANGGAMRISMSGIGASQHYRGQILKTSQAGGGVHASAGACKLHIQPKQTQSVFLSDWPLQGGKSLLGLRINDIGGGALDLVPEIGGEQWLKEVLS